MKTFEGCLSILLVIAMFVIVVAGLGAYTVGKFSDWRIAVNQSAQVTVMAQEQTAQVTVMEEQQTERVRIVAERDVSIARINADVAKKTDTSFIFFWIVRALAWAILGIMLAVLWWIVSEIRKMK